MYARRRTFAQRRTLPRVNNLGLAFLSRRHVRVNREPPSSFELDCSSIEKLYELRLARKLQEIQTGISKSRKVEAREREDPSSFKVSAMSAVITRTCLLFASVANSNFALSSERVDDKLARSEPRVLRAEPRFHAVLVSRGSAEEVDRLSEKAMLHATRLTRLPTSHLSM